MGAPGTRRDRTSADEIDHSLAEVLARADLILANAEPVAKRLRELAPVGPEVHVVPNAADVPPKVGRCPCALRHLPRPLIGYVGNLSSRSTRRSRGHRPAPDWTFVMAGSTHLDRSILALDRLPNMHFLGVLPYDRARPSVATSTSRSFRTSTTR